MTPADDFAQNAAVELDALKSLVALLLQESNALAAEDTEALVTLAAEKSAPMQILSDCAMRRDRMIRAGVTTADLHPMVNASSHNRELWDKVMRAAREAARLNFGNSYAVCQRLNKVHRALGVLGAARSPVYHAGGTSIQNPETSRSFGRA
ncbi:MAG: flagellar export chaperone FlgN [Burkholderiales bacterium]